MSNDLEQRLEALLAEAPEPDPGAGEKALHRALRALHPVATPRRGLRAGVLAFAAIVVLLVIAAGSLAAAGALHVSLGTKAKELPATTPLTLPRGANGIAAIVDGRLSVVIKGGFRLQGLAVTAAALSPHALFVAAGIRHSLVAIAPDGRRPWSHPVGGKVVAIAWAPFGNRIAYIVRTHRGLVLRMIWGNGTNDRVIDRSVRAVRPSWRGNSLAFAYVGAGGRAVVYDVGHQSRSVLAVRAPVTGVAFAPTGDSIAVQQPGGVWLLHESAAGKIRGDVSAFGWLHGSLADVVSRNHTSLVRLFDPDGSSRGAQHVRGSVVAVTSNVIVVRRKTTLTAGDKTVLTVPRRSVVRDLEIG